MTLRALSNRTTPLLPFIHVSNRRLIRPVVRHLLLVEYPRKGEVPNESYGFEKVEHRYTVTIEERATGC